MYGNEKEVNYALFGLDIFLESILFFWEYILLLLYVLIFYSLFLLRKAKRKNEKEQKPIFGCRIIKVKILVFLIE